MSYWLTQLQSRRRKFSKRRKKSTCRDKVVSTAALFIMHTACDCFTYPYMYYVTVHCAIYVYMHHIHVCRYSFTYAPYMQVYGASYVGISLSLMTEIGVVELSVVMHFCLCYFRQK